MSSNQFIEDNLTGHQIFVQRYANGVSRDITKGLKKLAKEIENKIKAGGGTLTVGQMSRLQNDLGELIKAIGLSEQIAQAGQEFTESEVEYFGNLLQRGTSATTITRIAPESLYATLSETPMLLTSASGVVTSMTINQMVDRFDEKIASDIMSRVRLGMIEGESVKKISRDVNRIVTTRTRRQTEAVVRTIINHVGNEARSYAANANREILQGERYTATLDSRTTLLCFPGETMVGNIGKLEKVYKRLYSGEFITITTSTGKKLTGTPNHPVLTSVGWLPLDEIKPCEHVVYTISDKSTSVLSGDSIKVPTSIGGLFDSFSKKPLGKVEISGSSANQFHGDGVTVDEKVNIASTNAFLWGDVDYTRVFQHIIKSVFRFIHNVVGFFRERFSKFLIISWMPTDKAVQGDVCFFDDTVKPRFSPLLRELWKDISWLKPIRIKFNGKLSVLLNSCVTNTSLEGWHYTKLFEKARNCCGGSFEVPTNSSGTLSTTVTGDDVVSVSSEFKTCHVYNLQCLKGVYHANLILVKNCASLDGNIYKVGEGPQAPLHYNCRSVRVPIVKDKYKIPGLTGERGAVGQNKDGTVSRGTVSSRTTYQSWLRRQPADFQDKVLGKERATLFRNGSFTLDRFVDSSGATITLDQLRSDDGILLNSRGTTQ